MNLTQTIQNSQKVTAKELTVLTALILVGLAIVYHGFYLGGSYFAYTGVGADTVEQYVPFYINYINSFRDGTLSLWNYDFGLGKNAFSFQMWGLDVFNLILVPCGLLWGTQALPAILIAIQSIKVLLCGIVFDLYAAHFCKNPVARICGALLYAFNGFLMLWGQHYFLGSACVYLIVILLCIEASLKDQRARNLVLMAIAIALTLISSVYLGFMIGLLILVYFIMRSIYLLPQGANNPITRYFKTYWKMYVFAILGCFLSCAVIVPEAFCLLGDSLRIVTDETLSSKALKALGTLSSPKELFVYVSRFMGNSLFATGHDSYPVANFYEAPQIGLSVGIIVFAFFYIRWLVLTNDKRARFIGIIALVLVVLYFIDGLPRTVLNAFAGPNFRSTFVFIPIACLMVSFVIEQVVVPKKMSVLSIALGFFASLIVLAVCVLKGSHIARLESIFSVVLLIIMCAALLLYQYDKIGAWAVPLVVLSMFAGLLCDAYITTNYRSPANAKTYDIARMTAEDNATQVLVDRAKSLDATRLYRIEKTFSEFTKWHDALVQSYPGISVYDSTEPPGVNMFYRKLMPENRTRPDSQIWTAYSNHTDIPNQLSYLGVDFLISDKKLKYSWCKKIDEQKDPYNGKTYYLYETTNMPSIARTYYSAVPQSGPLVENATDNELEHLIATTLITGDDYTGALLDPSADRKGYENFDVRVGADGRISGTVTTTGPAVLSLSIPFNKGWHILLNGEEVDKAHANYGFMCAYIPAGGIYAVEAYFVPEGLMTGIALSACALIVLIILSCILLIRRKRACM